MLGLVFLSKLNQGCYIISITKTASQKIWALHCSIKFLSSEVALYLYKSTIRPCMKYCCHAWAGAPSCYLELLDKLQKLAASLHLFYKYYIGRCSSELAQLVLFSYSQERSTCYSDRLHDFSVNIPRCYEDVMSTVLFLVQLNSEIFCLQNAFL